MCTPSSDSEGVHAVVHAVGHVLPIHHVLPLQTLGHVAGSVATHTIGNIIPLNAIKNLNPLKAAKKKRLIIDITALKSLKSSHDAVEPKKFNLQIEVVSAYSHHHHKTNKENNPNNMDDKNDSDSDEEIEKTAALISAEKKKNSRSSFHRLSLKSISTGQSAITSGQSALKNAISMSNPAKRLSHTFIVVKSINALHTTKNAYGKHPVWGESVYIDVGHSDFAVTMNTVVNNMMNNIMETNISERTDNNTNTTANNTANKNNNNNNNNTSNTSNSDQNGETPVHGNHTGIGFQVFLYRGVSGMETLVGYQFVPFSLLLPCRNHFLHENNGSGKNSEKKGNHGSSTSNPVPGSGTANARNSYAPQSTVNAPQSVGSPHGGPSSSASHINVNHANNNNNSSNNMASQNNDQSNNQNSYENHGPGLTRTVRSASDTSLSTESFSQSGSGTHVCTALTCHCLLWTLCFYGFYRVFMGVLRNTNILINSIT